jgi:hypothetical protein
LLGAKYATISEEQRDFLAKLAGRGAGASAGRHVCRELRRELQTGGVFHFSNVLLKSFPLLMEVEEKF